MASGLNLVELCVSCTWKASILKLLLYKLRRGATAVDVNVFSKTQIITQTGKHQLQHLKINIFLNLLKFRYIFLSETLIKQHNIYIKSYWCLNSNCFLLISKMSHYTNVFFKIPHTFLSLSKWRLPAYNQHQAVTQSDIYSWYSATIISYLGKSSPCYLSVHNLYADKIADFTVISPVDYTSRLLAGWAVFEVLSSFVASPTGINKSKLHTVNKGNFQNSYPFRLTI